MARPTRAWCLAALAILNLTVVGCSRTWPTVEGIGDPAFLGRAMEVSSIDLLPVDVQLWTYAKSTLDPDQESAKFDRLLTGLIKGEMARLGYVGGAQFQWDGEYEASDGRSVFLDNGTNVVASTAYTLSSFGTAQARTHDRVLTPFLVTRLGAETGSDATLYVGGWAYAGKDPKRSRAKRIARGVGFGLLAAAVVAVVVVVAIAAADGGGGKSGGGSGAGKVVSGAGRGLAKVGSGIGRAAGGFGRAASKVGRATARGVARAGLIVVRTSAQATLHSLDLLTHANIYFGEAEPYHYGAYEYYEDPVQVGTLPPAPPSPPQYGAPPPNSAPPPAPLTEPVPQPPGQPEQAPPGQLTPPGQSSPFAGLPRTYGSHFDVFRERPDYYVQKGSPHEGRSQVLLEMTLIDNQTGRALWHARQLFKKTNPRSETQMKKAIGVMFKSLPAAI